MPPVRKRRREAIDGPFLYPILMSAALVASMLASRDSAQQPFGVPVVPWRMPKVVKPAAAFESRQGPAMAALLAKSGGSQETQQAVDAALDWLARHQNPDGSWSLDYLRRCQGPGCTGPGTLDVPAAATGLALLPFLARGHTHVSPGPYRKTVYDGLDWLTMHQKATGDLSVTAGQTQMYSHAIATMALCEAYGMTRDVRLQLPAVTALHFIETGQDRQTGGWWYTHRQPGGDTSVFGWQLSALETGRKADLQPDHLPLELAKKWLAGVSHGNSQGLFSYLPNQPAKPSMTAVGLLGTQDLGALRDDPRLAEGKRFLMAHLPEVSPRDHYYWYYATQALHNLPGEDWDKWNAAMRKVLLQSQSRGPGCAAGSWDPAKPAPDPWGALGGRLLTTSLATLTLEVYYRYAPR